MAKETIALLGMGLMGAGMAGRLLDAGYPLTIYNRTAKRAEPLVKRGAKLARTPLEAASAAAVILSMVADDAASREIWLGENGALAGARRDSVLIESSTLSVKWIEELARAAEKQGVELIDAPVTGSKPQAASGELRFLAGGSAQAIDRVRPVLKVMSQAVIHLGPTGSGARMKLINNFVCAVQIASLAEALILIEQSGLQREQAVSILTEGAPSSPIVKGVSKRMLARDYNPNFSVNLMAKDLRYALGEARRQSHTLETGHAALGIFEAAILHGEGELDISSVVEQFRKSD